MTSSPEETNEGPAGGVCANCETRGEPFFCAVLKNGRSDLAGAAEEFPRGVLLFAEGQRPRGVYLLCRGRVKLSTSSGDARVLITDIAAPGYVLGLGGVVSGGYTYTRLTNDAAGLFIRSLPFVFQMPEARLSFKLQRRLDWNVGYQYYAYKEKPPFNTGLGYHAHLPYTSLRLYFGGRE